MKYKKKFEEMLEFTNEHLKQRGFDINYTNKNEENRLFCQKNNSKTGLILLNYQMPLNELESLFNKNIRDFGSNNTIFYKDGKTFFKRMVDNSSLRADKSLKKYSLEDINKIISLTIQERSTLFNFDKLRLKRFGSQHLKDKNLIYYQPQTKRLERSIRKFNPEPVFLDYSHLNNDDSGYDFAKEGISKTYFFMNEK